MKKPYLTFHIVLFISIALNCEAQPIAAGSSHSLFLCPDSATNAVGWNGYGQLGIGNTNTKISPIQQIGLNGVIAVSSGYNHCLFLKNDNAVWSVGLNNRGQLGDSSYVNKSTAVQIAGLTDVIAISGGGLHSLFLKSDGTVWAVGFNGYGQLGDSTTIDTAMAKQITGLTGITALAAGDNHSLFLKNDSTVWAVGRNIYGQLGDSTTVNKSIPVQVLGLTGITAIAAGNDHSLFLKNDSTVWAAGWNAYGQLGDSSTVNKSTAVQVKGLTQITALAAGQYHSLFIKNDSTVWAVGRNSSGQLGDSTTVQKTIAVPVSGLSGISAIAGGGNHSVFQKNDGTVWAVGDNSLGQLGDGTTINKTIAVQTTGLCIPLSVSVSVMNNVSCNGGNNGSISTIVSGGNSPYSYLWNNGSTQCTLTNLYASTFTITVTDAGGNSVTANVTITEPLPVSTSISATNTTCDSCTDGTAMITVTGGVSPYAYQWSNGDSLLTINNLAAGFYTVSVTDSNGCSVTTSTFVNHPYSEQCSNRIIYVTPSGSDTGNSGTITNPASLEHAFNIATSNSQIWLALGNYTISNELNLLTGITLEGGFDPANNWIKTNLQPTVITRDTNNIDLTPNRLVAIEGLGISHFNIHDISIITSDASGQGVSTYGIHLSNCSDYTLSRVSINAGNATDGIDGTAGSSGLNGTNGQQGQPGDEDGPCCTGGGAGGSGSFPGSNSGGDGGAGGARGTGVCFGNGGTAPNGLPGFNGMGCSGGEGGWGGQGMCGFPFSVGCDQTPASIGSNGIVGGNGGNGLDGDSGIYSFGVYFIPGNGYTGQNGENGSGGGGGGGGGSQGCVNTCFSNTNGAGPGGNGGGEGGQGGFGGSGGHGGGGSFGIYIHENGSNSFLYDCLINAGLPGNGGVGGIGGNGGNGGFGATPGNIGCDIGSGGTGGNGGNGGNGGSGGIGMPGISAPVYQDTTGVPIVTANMQTQPEPVIFVENPGTVFADVTFSTTATGNIEWIFDSTSTMMNAFGDSVTVQFTQTGRHSIILIVDSVPYVFKGFVGIFYGVSEVSTSLSICSGDSMFLSGSWQFAAGTYYDTLQTVNGCDSIVVNTLMVNSNPTSLTSSTNDSVCSGESTLIWASGSGGSGNYVFEWTGQTFVGSGPHNVSPNSTTDYCCTVTDDEGCTTNDCITIEILPLPDISLTSTPDSGNASGTATVVASGGTAPYGYLWSNGVQTQGIASLQAGMYYVTVTDANGCDMVDSVFVDFYSGKLEVGSRKSEVVIVPNPNGGVFELSVTGNQYSVISVKIYNMLGEVIYYSLIPSFTHSIIDLSKHGSGIYFLQISDENTGQTAKIIVE